MAHPHYDLNENFRIICVSKCTTVLETRPPESLGGGIIEVGEIFDINHYEFNYSGDFDPLVGYLRLSRNYQIIGLFKKKNFRKLEDYREDKINEILN